MNVNAIAAFSSWRAATSGSGAKHKGKAVDIKTIPQGWKPLLAATIEQDKPNTMPCVCLLNRTTGLCPMDVSTPYMDRT